MPTTTTTTQPSYRPQDYNQDQINEGQRKVNYALTEVDEKFVEILKIVKDAIQVPHGQAQPYVDRIDEAIKEATEAVKHVAEIIPPGCDPNGSYKGQ